MPMKSELGTRPRIAHGRWSSAAIGTRVFGTSDVRPTGPRAGNSAAASTDAVTSAVLHPLYEIYRIGYCIDGGGEKCGVSFLNENCLV